ncbi:hypothetical protein AGMMS49960_04320 [Betaproteobacteria bacterium]|nr:hypothetical protein AGMMS49960_04320 [Betaproteobacteria bacterium]
MLASPMVEGASLFHPTDGVRATLAVAADDDSGLDAYFEAYAKFEQMVAEATSATPPDMPRITEPAAAEVIAILSDSKRFLTQSNFRLEHLDKVSNMCGTANKISMTYVMFDLKNHVDVGADPAAVTVQVMNVMGRNSYTFQGELKLLGPFLYRCLARQIPVMTEFISKLKPEELTDVRLAGLQRVRKGILQTIAGTILFAVDESSEESYRAAILQALAENASQYISLLSIPERQQILTLIASAQPNAPSFARKHLATISAAMSDTSCTGLCAY